MYAGLTRTLLNLDVNKWKHLRRKIAEHFGETWDQTWMEVWLEDETCSGALDLRWRGRGFDSRSRSGRVTTPGKFFTSLWPCHPVPVNRQWSSATGKVTVGLALRWRRALQTLGVYSTRLYAYRRQMSTPHMLRRGVQRLSLSIPMAQLSHDQFWGSILLMEIQFWKSFISKTPFSPQMSNYTREKFCLATVWGQTGGRPPRPSLRTSPGWGVIAPVFPEG